jgi:exopolyphosphatase/guanosine-5'-triphosphate,3'-diphosphate pyrophosphatase
LVLEHLVRIGKPKEIVFSALGVREGLLYRLLDAQERREDPLLAAARDLNVLRSRSPQHGEEMIGWTDGFMASSGLDESAQDQRLRHAACLLGDIGWRAHPDYRGEQSLNIIAHGGFVAIDHPGRAFLALTVYFRHVGTVADELSPRLRQIASARIIERTRILGALMRVAYLVSAAMPGVLPKTPLRVEDGRLVLNPQGDLAALDGGCRDLRSHNAQHHRAAVIKRETQRRGSHSSSVRFPKRDPKNDFLQYSCAFQLTFTVRG